MIIIAQYVNCAAANPGADAGMYDASEQYKLSTVTFVPESKYFEKKKASRELLNESAVPSLFLLLFTPEHGEKPKIQDYGNVPLGKAFYHNFLYLFYLFYLFLGKLFTSGIYIVKVHS